MKPPSIHIVSGGVGTSGEALVNTVLAQFPGASVRLIVIPHVRDDRRLNEVVLEARREEAVLVHTMVDPNLRRLLIERCRSLGVPAIDLMGPLFESLESALGQKPLGQPGLYRQLKKDYFERVAAIEYAMAHDDGRNPSGWEQADLLLIGVSRVGKTPLSLYLSVQGWKAANYPFVPGLNPPESLDRVDPQRVVGLTIEPGQLLALREERQRRIGVIGIGSYTDPQSVYAEIELARAFYKRRGFSILDVTDKPIETTADEITRLIAARFPHKSRLG